MIQKFNPATQKKNHPNTQKKIDAFAREFLKAYRLGLSMGFTPYEAQRFARGKLSILKGNIYANVQNRFSSARRYWRGKA